MQRAAVRDVTYGGAGAIALEAGRYQAIVLPSIGGHLVALRDETAGLRFLREPLAHEGDDLSRYREDPIPYGVPLLFPPNRIADGRFTFGGHTYRFPINEPALRNHLHGFFAKDAWEVTAREVEGESARLVLRRRLRDGDEVYSLFPHPLTLELHHTLTPGGLRHELRVRNDGERPMPLLVGFHTALKIPFAPEGSATDCSVAMNLGPQWELSERKLPTGRQIPLGAMAQAIAQGGGDPFAHPVDALFDAAPGDGPNECSVLDRRAGMRFLYQTDRAYRAWMLWNGDGRSGFLCAEPMTCLVNAPNLALPAAVSGMQALAPGAQWSALSRLFAREEGA